MRDSSSWFTGENRSPRAGSGFFFSLRLEGLRGEFAAGLLQKDFYFAFSLLELLLAFAGEGDTFLKQSHGVIEREIRVLESANDFFEAREGMLEFRFLPGFGTFRLRRIHGHFKPQLSRNGALRLASRAKKSRAATLFDAASLAATTTARFALASVNREDAIEAGKPPLGVAKIGRRVDAAF
jgi:hypothetical protein